MKTIIKTSIAFSLGIITGATIGIFVTKRVYEEKVEQESKRNQEYYAKKLAEINTKAKEEAGIKFNPDKRIGVVSTEGEGYISSAPSEIDYHDIYKKNPDREAELKRDALFPEVEVPEGTPEEKEAPVIFDITREEFLVPNDYDKYTFTLYADGTWADDGNAPVDDLEMLVGNEAVEALESGRESELYIRNDIQCEDFELWRSPDTYSDVVGDKDDTGK